MYEAERAAAVRAAQRASDVIDEYHHDDLRRVEATEQKSGGVNDIVTKADKKAQAAIKSVIDAEFPDDRFIGEEDHASEHESGTDREWVVDPIDGTVNFSSGLPLYNTSIAFRVGDEVKVGVVASPTHSLDRLWVAERGKGAELMTLAGTEGLPISVSEHDQLDGSIISCFTDCEVKLVDEAAVNTRRLASAALTLALVAEGRLDAYTHVIELSEWDVAAGKLLVEESGGTVVEREEYDDGTVRPMIVSNSELSEELVEILDPVEPTHL